MSIFSNGFNFRLDKSKKLGMVNLIVIEHPQLFALDNWTAFVMDLDIDDEDYAMVKSTLQQLNPEMLLFTSRLRQIEISVRQSSSIVETSRYRVALQNNSYPFVYGIQHNDTTEDTKKYLVHNMLVSGMPDHSARQGVSNSQIALAFPFTESTGPVSKGQNIFAFMPLRRSSLHVT